MDKRNIVIFDGVCNFCNGAVNFIIKHNPNARFAFTPMQSELAQKLIEKYGIHNVPIDTFLLIKDEKCFIWTDAEIEIAKDLSGFWYLTTGFKIIPKPIRDWFYRLFARNRYALFGRTHHCMVPDPKLQERFIGV